jgi:hypothetical protein
MGFHLNMPASEYHAMRAVSAGMAWDVCRECPAYAFARSSFAPNPVAEDQARALDIGTALHLAVLEPRELAARVVVIDAENFRTKLSQENRDAAYAAGKTPLLVSQYQAIGDMRQLLEASEAAELLFGAADNEVSYDWYCGDDIGSLRCKARADRIVSAPTGTTIVDLKSAISASPTAFQRAIARDGHHLRAAWYKDGLREQWMTRERVRYIFVVVAKEPPHLVAMYELDERAEEWGRRLYRRALDEIRTGLETGRWRGYSAEGGEQINTISLPSWSEYALADMEMEGKL